MNKYQKFVCSQIRYYQATEANLKPTETYSLITEEHLDIKQNENYNIVKYTLLFAPTIVESVTINGKKYTKLVEIEGFHPLLAVPIDFTKRAEEIVVSVKNKAVDDIHIKLNYIEADKTIFDAKEADRIRRETAEKACIKIATGTDLVNVYFQHCSEKACKTIIELYNVGVSKMLLGKFAVEEGMFFKSITGLAFGHYEIKVAQFDKDGGELFTSDPIKFELKNPNYRDEHVVII